MIYRLDPKDKIKELLALADVEINGNRSSDMQILNDDFYSRVVSGGSLALGESYMDGWWNASRLDLLFEKLLSAQLYNHVKTIRYLPLYMKSFLSNMQNKKHAIEVATQHYDIGNDLYTRMLDKRMTYTCGYWREAENLDEAQEHKLDLVCRKVGLQPGMKVLDIGCGWGSFAKYAAEHYGVSVVGITIAKEQVKLGNELCQGLPVELRLQDYRDVTGEFDAVVSLGMFEHVGIKNYKTFFSHVRDVLKPEGLFLLHTIGSNHTEVNIDPWVHKYIFPNGQLPSLIHITKNIDGLLIIEDLHSFGMDYYKTLKAWHENFATHWHEIEANYDPRFYKMWEYYLESCAGSFRARDMQLWQIVLSGDGVKGGYLSIR